MVPGFLPSIIPARSPRSAWSAIRLPAPAWLATASPAFLSSMPRSTGQDIFRDALMTYWNRRCPLTGITEPELPRASHIVPWADCETDAQRLDVHNGLLLSALWDAAFDAGLASFGDDGTALFSPQLGDRSRAALNATARAALVGLTPAHCRNLAWHRARHDFT